MSKFKVLVVGPESFRELSDILEPFDEHLEFPSYVKFTREDIAKKRKNLLKYWKKLHNNMPEDTGILNRLLSLGKNDEDYFDAQTSSYNEHILNDNGEPVTTYNPNTKFNHWDYINDLSKRHSYITSSASLKKDIDWHHININNIANAIENWPKIQKSEISDIQKLLVYDFWPDETRQQYLDRRKLFMTHAYVLHGKWYERCSIDWWNNVYDIMDRDKWIEQYMTMLKQIKPNTVLTTIECNL